MAFEDVNKEQYENILRYLDGLMTHEEELLFERQLKESQKLQEAVKFENELRQYLEAPEEKTFLQEAGINAGTDYNDIHNIRSLVEEEGARWKQKKNKTFRLRTLLTYLAAACILGFLAFFLWRSRESKTDQLARTNKDMPPAVRNNDSPVVAKIQIPKGKDPITLFKKYFSMDESSGKRPELLAAALDDYDKGKYARLREMDLTNIPPPDQTRGASEDETEDTVTNTVANIKQVGHYFKGLALIKIDKIPDAKTNLQWVIDSASSYKLKIKSEWYLSLIYIKEGKIEDKGVPYLKHVAASTIEPYNKKAEELLGELDS